VVRFQRLRQVGLQLPLSLQQERAVVGSNLVVALINDDIFSNEIVVEILVELFDVVIFSLTKVVLGQNTANYAIYIFRSFLHPLFGT
jgi:hypothetical protein